jgi:hypothetical protein
MNEKLAEDWVTLWRSELTAMAADRELRESWAAMVTLWSSAATTAMSRLNTRYDSPPGNPPAAQPPRPEAAPAAPDAGLDEIERLNRRVAELERRLAEFQRDPTRP